MALLILSGLLALIGKMLGGKITSPMALAVITLCLPFLLYKLYRFLQKRRAHREQINKIPGPPALPIIGNLLDFMNSERECMSDLDRTMEKYCHHGILRLWGGETPYIFITKAQVAETFLSNNFALINKATSYDFFKPWLREGLILAKDYYWRRRRKMLTPAFHFSVLQNFTEVFREQGAVLVERLQDEARKNEPFDIHRYLGACALDIICETAMGYKINAQSGANMEYVEAVKTMSCLALRHERMPWLWFKPLWYLSGDGFQFNRSLKILQQFTRKVIEERMQDDSKSWEKEGKKAFLDLLLSHMNKGDLTFEDVAEETDTFMFEGHDTTSAGMSWTLFLLGHHPDIQERVYEEVVSIIGSSRERIPTLEDIKQMPYFERVLKESLRLYPSVPILGRRVQSEVNLGGYDIPVGSTVVLLPWRVHRDKEWWGDDPDRFDPDRFLPEKCAKRHAFSYIPFSGGSRNCIGQKFALTEEKIVLTQLLRAYKFESLDSRQSMRPIPDIILRPPSRQFILKISSR